MNLTRAAVSLVLTELDLGATFCEVALCTQDEKTKERNIRNARKAYETALHLLQRLILGSTEQARFDEKALHLNGLFEQLGLSPCLSSIILSPLNGNVKMSPHETGDIHVESEGTAASERNQRMHQGRHGVCQSRRTPVSERATD